jgi:hypothetical protein
MAAVKFPPTNVWSPQTFLAQHTNTLLVMIAMKHPTVAQKLSSGTVKPMNPTMFMTSPQIVAGRSFDTSRFNSGLEEAAPILSRLTEPTTPFDRLFDGRTRYDVA